MPDEYLDGQFCGPCKKLLFHDYSFSYENDGCIHHPHTDTFKTALELPCTVCSFAWSQCSLPDRGEDLQTLSWKIRTEYGIELAFAMNVFFANGSRLMYSNKVVMTPMKRMADILEPPILLSHDTRSGVDFLRDKLEECRAKHFWCRPQQSSSAVYPSRILDIGESVDSLVRLRDAQNLDDQGPYICLSHCWGKKQPIMLTKETSSILQDGIPVSALPKTFQDAVFVTHMLRIQFLWIDSLCIAQDNETDWVTEARRMSDVYSRAACTIAATAAGDSDGGLFFQRDPRLLRPRCIKTAWALDTHSSFDPSGSYWCDIAEFWKIAVEEAPLNSRAWVCQERHLSSRIMHFTKTQLAWECYENVSCESYPRELPEFKIKDLADKPYDLKKDLIKLQLRNPDESPHEPKSTRSRIPTKNDLYVKWAMFRGHYTSCGLTKDEDKLLAIQGIAQQFGETLGDHMLAGLWYNRILDELCWFRVPYKDVDIRVAGAAPQKLTKWRAPTWSWASDNAKISIGFLARYHGVCSGKQTLCELENTSVKTSVTGELTYASLQIRCKLIRATVQGHRLAGAGYCIAGSLIFQQTQSRLQVGTPPAEVAIDDVGFHYPKVLDVYVVAIQLCLHDKDETHDDKELSQISGADGLLLIPQHGSEDIFTRVGYFSLPNEGLHILLREYEAAESKTITII